MATNRQHGFLSRAESVGLSLSDPEVAVSLRVTRGIQLTLIAAPKFLFADDPARTHLF
jgi:hypothetical protein